METNRKKIVRIRIGIRIEDFYTYIYFLILYILIINKYKLFDKYYDIYIIF